ncbi:MAG: AmmeMemoRadiSam system radical SAM enzyme [Microgenomates group bacterium]|nr:AmmeMemoRadiSam system radical SAM enzyme [Microgenomates group bacterium]
MKKAFLFQKLEENGVRCLACSWYCQIAPNQVGICATRINKNGNLYSLVYGKAIGLHPDPVEKKPLFHFLPKSRVLSFGTLGCNFGCLFCQNWQMSQINKDPLFRKNHFENNLIKLIDKNSINISPQKIVAMAKKIGAAGIAYTYNEPAIFVEFAHDTAKLAKKNRLKNIYVSNGFESTEAFDYIKDYLDAINIDLKSFNQSFYQKICLAKIEPVKNNIKKFFQSGIETEVTTLIIPGLNNSRTELEELTKFLVSVSHDLPWHVSAFYPAYKMVDRPPTSHQTLINAYEIGKQAGLNYIYVGNIIDSERSSTFCPRCHQLLVFRQGYQVEIKNINLKTGRCNKCRKKIYGIWS